MKSTRAAARYLKDLHDYYGRWYLAAATYNAGPTIVDRDLQQSGAKDFWSIKRKSQLSEETRNFVPKFVAIALIAMDPKKYRFDDIGYHLPLDYDEVELKAPMTLAAIARTAETDLMTLRALNPSFCAIPRRPANLVFARICRSESRQLFWPPRTTSPPRR